MPRAARADNLVSMSALAYLVPPLSGAVAFFRGTSVRVRFHGLQSIAFGTLWPALLWLCSFVSAAATQVVFGAGAGTWLLLLFVTAGGRDPRLPLLGRALAHAAEIPPGGVGHG